jgi:integrase
MRHQLEKPKGRKYYELRFTDRVTGKRKKKSTGKETRTEAQAWADEFLKEYVPGESGKVTVGDLVERFLTAQQVEFPERARATRKAWRVRMKDKFAHIDARQLKGRDTLDYINWVVGAEVNRPAWGQVRAIYRWPGKEVPSEAPLAKGTANLDIAILQGAYTHAKKHDDFNYRPHFATFDVSDNVREGFLEQWEFDRIIAVIAGRGPEYLWLRAFLTMAYECGNRCGELTRLRVQQFNAVEGIVRLKALDTKSKKARELGVSNELYLLLQACCEGKRPDGHVFTRWRWSSKTKDWAMRPVGTFAKLWRTILTQAGIERDILIHDLRRSAVSNMIQSGADRDEVRLYSGHSQAGFHSMLSRYHILRRERILATAKRAEAYKEEQRQRAAELAPEKVVVQ